MSSVLVVQGESGSLCPQGTSGLFLQVASLGCFLRRWVSAGRLHVLSAPFVWSNLQPVSFRLVKPTGAPRSASRHPSHGVTGSSELPAHHPSGPESGLCLWRLVLQNCDIALESQSAPQQADCPSAHLQGARGCLSKLGPFQVCGKVEREKELRPPSLWLCYLRARCHRPALRCCAWRLWTTLTRSRHWAGRRTSIRDIPLNLSYKFPFLA